MNNFLLQAIMWLMAGAALLALMARRRRRRALR
jgi:hypothetical protein